MSFSSVMGEVTAWPSWCSAVIWLASLSVTVSFRPILRVSQALARSAVPPGSRGGVKTVGLEILAELP